MVSGGTDNHLLLIDLRNKKVNGAVAAYALEKAGIVLNKNGVPFDTNPPFYPSGIRLGTPAITTRGMREGDMKKVAEWIDLTITAVGEAVIPKIQTDRNPFMKEMKKKINANSEIKKIEKEVKSFASKFPLP